MKKINFIVVLVLLIVSALVVVQQVKNKPKIRPSQLKGYQEYVKTEFINEAKDTIRQFYAKPVTFPQPDDSDIYTFSPLGDDHCLVTGLVVDPNDVPKKWEVVRARRILQDSYIVVYIKIGIDVILDIRKDERNLWGNTSDPNDPNNILILYLPRLKPESLKEEHFLEITKFLHNIGVIHHDVWYIEVGLNFYSKEDEKYIYRLRICSKPKSKDKRVYEGVYWEFMYLTNKSSFLI